MKKILLILFIIIGLKATSQNSFTTYSEVTHGDTVWLIKTVNSFLIDSAIRYNYFQQCDSVLVQDTMRWVCTLDSTQYTYYYRMFTGAVKDSTQLNKLTTSQLNNTAGFITPTALVPYTPRSDSLLWLITAWKLKQKTDSLADAVATSNAATYFTIAAAAGKLGTNGNGGSLTGLTKTQVGLSAADNTSDASKPVSTAQATAIALKSSIYVGTDAGANDSYVITASPAPASYTAGMVVIFRANTINTGAASLNCNGLGVRTIVKRVSTVLANADIAALKFCMVIFDGTNFVLLNPTVN